MCCCIKSRALPQWTIFILSIATCITSGLMIAYAVVFIYSDLVENLLNEEFLQRQYSDIYDEYGESAQEYAVAAFACFAGLAMLMAVCGCCCKCLKGGASRTCACLYGFCLLPVMIIFLCVGASLAYLVQISEEEIEKQCPKLVDYAVE